MSGRYNCFPVTAGAPSVTTFEAPPPGPGRSPAAGHPSAILSTPYNSVLLAQARVDPEWGQYLEFLIPYGADDVDERDGDTATFRAFVGAAQAQLRTTPQLRERRLPLGRRYDQLHYLLAREGHRCEPRRDDPLTQAIFGGAALHPAATTTQGFPIRYLAPTEVEAVLAALRDVDLATLKEHFDPPAMAAAGVYKIRGDKDATALQWLLDDFDKLLRFYTLVTAHSEGVFTSMD